MEPLKQYRPFFVFLAKFFGVYAVLTVIYRLYLNTFDPSKLETDSITWSVARQTKWFLELLGRQCELAAHSQQPSVKLILDGHYIARVVEGCNAISVMILFVAFVIAFKGKWLTTALFIVSGIVIIHILNVWRIALLAMALLRFPESEGVLHGVIFPAVIYGVVLLLWIVWVNKFSLNAKK
ncbi:exosortase family protein XrtF [Flavobacterium silvaticum]|uniref:Exosortase family protein XrtF n=1 Tax=Flavobacterium silvaticum TaxID=1852020 RepID=A0A972FQK7_9FLAO|nr:exosortase family protein XrtF [Flavobacterium silvaticum]NMH27559.1 exosortase family protein XrtF [Flavobacterium silvaticum]